MKLFGTYEIHAYVRGYLETLGDLSGKIVVDIPAGTGSMSALLREQGATVEAYDLFPEFFRVDGLACERADLSEPLPIPDAHADYVLCQEGIEHIPDQLGALREFNRILKPGGRVILTTPSNSNLRARLSHFLIESDLYNRLPPNELDSIWFSELSRQEFYFGHIFLTGIQHLRVLGSVAGLRIDKIHSVKASGSSLVLGVFLPAIVLVNLFAYVASFRRHKNVDPEWKRSIFGEILRFNLNPNVLFGKHLFLDLVKEHELADVGKRFRNKLKETG